jgi:hypothetical protein
MKFVHEDNEKTVGSISLIKIRELLARMTEHMTQIKQTAIGLFRNIEIHKTVHHHLVIIIILSATGASYMEHIPSGVIDPRVIRRAPTAIPARIITPLSIEATFGTLENLIAHLGTIISVPAKYQDLNHLWIFMEWFGTAKVPSEIISRSVLHVSDMVCVLPLLHNSIVFFF